MYIIKITTTIRGKKTICYKLGITDNLKERLRTYRTGNPNIDLISYFKIKGLEARTVENCMKSVLKFKKLKKDNEIFCTSLKNIYRLLQSCVLDGEIEGYCHICDRHLTIKKLKKHINCQINNNK